MQFLIYANNLKSWFYSCRSISAPTWCKFRTSTLLKTNFLNYLSLAIGLLFFPSLSAELSNPPQIKTFLQALPEEEKTLLDNYLRVLTRDSFSGYVLYGDKPMSIEPLTYQSSALFDQDIKTLLIRKGVELWQSLRVSPENKEYSFLIFDAKEWGYHHLVCINRKAFLRVVNENLSLFRYVLGPTLSAESLLNALLTAQDQFYTILKNDRVLLGILLGYGEQNALLVSRKELISEQIDQFPLLSKKQTPPSIGFVSLTEEYETLKKTTALSRHLKPFDLCKIPYFGCDPSSTESQELLTVYEKNRSEIIQAVKADDFLEKVLCKLFTTTSGQLQIPSIPIDHPSPSLADKENITNQLAFYIYQEIREEKYFLPSFAHAFLQGIIDRENSKPFQNIAQLVKEIYLTSRSLDACKNLHQANDCLMRAVQNKNLIPLIPNKVYYEVLERGQGATLPLKTSAVTMHYAWQSPEKEAPDVGTIKNERLEHLIPGVAHALIGMQRGERRKLYIHPEYGYGEETDMPPNLLLIAEVQLIDFKEGEAEVTFTAPHQLKEQNYETLLKKYEKLQKARFYAKGMEFWDFTKSGKKWVDFKQFCKHFNRIAQGKDSSNNRDINQDKFLTDLHWRLLSASHHPT